MKLIRENTANDKKMFEHLLRGESIQIEIDEQIVYDQLTAKKMLFGGKYPKEQGSAIGNPKVYMLKNICFQK